MNFRGRSLRSLDPKGRLMLSPEYRESLYLRQISPKASTLDTSNNSIFSTNTDTACSVQDSSTQQANEISTKTTQEHNNSIETEAPQKIIAPESIKFVITTYDHCLAAFPWNDWLKLEEQFSRLPNPSSKVRAFRRLFIGGAEEQNLDAQGRVRLSSDHRQYAELEKEVNIIGLITRFEIWNPQILKASLDAQSLDDVTDELSASGIDFAL